MKLCEKVQWGKETFENEMFHRNKRVSTPTLHNHKLIGMLAAIRVTVWCHAIRLIDWNRQQKSTHTLLYTKEKKNESRNEDKEKKTIHDFNKYAEYKYERISAKMTHPIWLIKYKKNKRNTIVFEEYDEPLSQENWNGSLGKKIHYRSAKHSHYISYSISNSLELKKLFLTYRMPFQKINPRFK